MVAQGCGQRCPAGGGARAGSSGISRSWQEEPENLGWRVRCWNHRVGRGVPRHGVKGLVRAAGWVLVWESCDGEWTMDSKRAETMGHRGDLS